MSLRRSWAEAISEEWPGVVITVRRPPVPYARARSADGRSRLDSLSLDVSRDGQRLAELRTLRVRAGKMSVWVLVGHAAEGRGGPLLAAELVIGPKGLLIAFMDLPDPGRTAPVDAAWIARLRRLRKDTSVRHGEDPAAAWATEHGRGGQWFRRPEGAVDEAQAQAILLQYLRHFARAHAEGERSSGPTKRPAGILDTYRRGIVENSPGGPFMHRAFGEAWVAKYERDYLHRSETSR